MANNEFKGLGRRKTSVAKVKMVAGSGKILINGKKPEEYFPNALVIQEMKVPLTLTSTENSYDIMVKVSGGGFTGQAGAIRLGIARALVQANEEFHGVLKSEKQLTRDPRAKERKKYGLYGARRRPQFTKR